MKPVTLAGICCDHNSTFQRGAASAPVKIRRALYSNSSNLFSEKGYDIEQVIRNDLGDFSIEDSRDGYLKIETIAAPCAQAGEPLLSLGGDHSITYPLIKAFAKEYGPLDILHLDAHPDLYDDFDGNRYAHACPFARILEKGLAKRLVQVGIRTLTPHQKEQAIKYQVEIHHMKDWPTVVPDFSGPLYVSIDLDVLDPAFAPGISHHEPGGMSVRQIISLIHKLNCPIIGADIVEYNPTRDIMDMTAMTGAKILKELAGQMSQNAT